MARAQNDPGAPIVKKITFEKSVDIFAKIIIIISVKGSRGNATHRSDPLGMVGVK